MEFLWRLIRPTATPMTTPSFMDVRTDARALLTSAKLDLQRLDEQMARLAAQRDEQVQLIALLTSMDPPIQRLPNEVLSEVFLDLVQQSLMLDGGFCAALRVSHVCKRWRGVSLSTRRLWTSVPLKQFANPEATKTLVQRSHPLPLSCTLARPLEAHDLDDILGSAWDRLADFFTTQIAALHALNRLAAGAPFKLLRRLVVGPLDIPDEKIALALFVNAPLLREVALTHTILPLPFAQLTQLQLAHVPGEVCLEAVRQCRNLTILNLAMNPWAEIGPQADVVPYTLPVVEEFALGFCPHPDDARHCIEPMLAALDLPALVKFIICFTDDIEWPKTAQRDLVFDGFLQRAPKLRTLELVNCTLDSAQLLGALRNTPALEEAVLTQCETATTNDFLDELTLPAAGDDHLQLLGVLLPRLTTLRLLMPDRNVLDEQALLGMLRSRWWWDGQEPPHGNAIARLKEFCLDCDRGSDEGEDFRADIERLRAEGMVVSVSPR